MTGVAWWRGASFGAWGADPHLLGFLSLSFEIAEQSARAGRGGRLLAGGRFEPGHDRRDVVLRGLGGDAQTPRDFRITQAFAEQPQDLHLAAGESRRIGARPRNGAARHSARPV